MDTGEESLELKVIRLVKSGWRSREVLEAEHPERAGIIDDDRVLLNNWASTVHREGMALAFLAVTPSTRVEMHERMDTLPDAAPAWVEAQARGEPLTAKLFARGLAQALAIQREAIERVAREQMEEPDPMWKALAEVSVPSADLASQSELIQGVGRAMTAHLKALVAIARDLEEGFRAERAASLN